VNDLFDQVEDAVNHGLYYVALFGALALPDICGAMETSDGKATKTRYISWFDRYVAPKYTTRSTTTLSGTDAYYFRCSMLHQGRTRHSSSTYSRILFLEPGQYQNGPHNNVMNDALNIDVSTFCADVVEGARSWLAAAEHSANFERNYPLFVQRYPGGLSPYISGPTVIG
jgi:hypothetical protein